MLMNFNLIQERLLDREYNTAGFIFKRKAGMKVAFVGKSGTTACVYRRAMKPERLYQELKDLADQLGVAVFEHSFRSSGVPVKSGSCRIRGKIHCVIDKNVPLRRKTWILARCLSDLPHQHLYVVPVVREIMSKCSRRPVPKPE
jgi:hypothetical protein